MTHADLRNSAIWYFAGALKQDTMLLDTRNLETCAM